VQKRSALFLMVGCTGLLVMLALSGKRPAKVPDSRLATLTQTYIAVDGRAPVRVPRLITADGDVLTPERLHGHWNVIFFGFTACPLVCPKTLVLLTAVAGDPESGVSSGATETVFVSIDPEHDTPKSIRSYLQHFGGHILGLTGSRHDIESFSREIGAGSQAVGSAIDHSTSLFVLDPKGRLAGILLRPNDSARIVADLSILRRLHADPRISMER
jgi:cytochrome oxidase Cu insertion factor (SCO1/SenC/PrrC family)